MDEEIAPFGMGGSALISSFTRGETLDRQI